MRFDFDPHKDFENRKRHGIDFEEAQRLWERTHVIIPAKDVRGEKRFAILGKIQRKVFIAIYTERNDVIRIISCHRADKNLERIYYEKIKEKEE